MEVKRTSEESEQVLKQYYSRYGGFWVYPDMLDYCYLVNPYFNRSKIVDEMQDNFRVLLSEYPSGMGVNSKLASECWGIRQEYIIPGNGAAELIKVFMEGLDGKVGVVRPTFEEYPNRLPDVQVVTFVPLPTADHTERPAPKWYALCLLVSSNRQNAFKKRISLNPTTID